MMVGRAARIEAIRLLRDPTLAACVGIAVLPVIALVAGIPEAVPREQLADALEGPMRMSLLANVALLGAAFGAVRTAAAFHAGVVGRDALVLHAGPPFWTRVVATAVGAGAVGGAMGVFALLGTSVLNGLHVFGPASLAAAVVVAAGAGVWGSAIGALVRSPLAALPIAIVSLSPAMFLSTVVPDVAAVLPLSSALHAAGSPLGDSWIGRDGSAAIALLWLIVALGAAFLTYRRRSLLA
ncbi:hypothetical protein [Microbacterium sp. 179-I 3D3 NHS]|uniref:hypothetical protein n=1 Tax=Microbacterium sp. 179-I 3D3 NHS TaxID=3142382 RepID=UPI0039A25A05